MGRIKYLFALISLSFFCTISYSKSTYDVPVIEASKILSFYGIDYSAIKQRLYKKERAKEIERLTQHVVINNRIPSPFAKEIIHTVYTECEKEKIDPILFLSLIEVESSFNQYAKSHVGAIGLSQVMPIYHKSKVDEIKKHNLDLWSIKGNIKVGVQVLSEYLKVSKGNTIEALQRYNGSLDDQTRKYSNKVLATSKKYKANRG